MNPLASDSAHACPSCGAGNLPEARFCSQCGLALDKSWQASTLTISSPPHSLPLSHRSLGVASTRPPPADAPPGPLSLRSVSPLLERTPDARELADPLIGVVVAERYRIKEPIGRGGMGVVYRVEHARIGKLMALKLLTGELTRDPQQVARFKREAQMVSRLSHPNTVQVFDFGASEGLVYLAMEYLKGEDLGHLIRRVGPLGVERTLKIVIQICSSLGEAHGKGMVHRDLKPENIIVMPGAEDEDLIKVLDFGLAKLREGGELSEVTSRGAIVGTPYYMSPEQIRGDDVGPESDVYALGALTYACLTGTVVFDARTPMGVLTKHLTELPESPSQRFPELKIPKSVSQIVLAALEKDRKRRLPSVEELQRAMILELEHGGKQQDVERLLDYSHLRHAGAGADADAVTRDEVERYERKLRRRGRAAWALLAALSLAAAFFGFRAYQRWTAPAVFTGEELEPNDAASTATRVPFPWVAKGVIGKRLDPERSDRDFYRFRVPTEASAVSLEASPVAGLAWCGLLYASGSEEPLGRYCPGIAERRLRVEALRLPPGEYVLGLMQDREAYTKEPAPATFESISQSYQLSVTTNLEAGAELEPNDFPRDALRLAPGQKLSARLAWMRDLDVVCASGDAKVRLKVTDSPERPRARAAVLQVTPLAGADAEVPVRVHHAGAKDVQASPRDVLGTWQSTVLDPSAGRAPCVQLTLVPNPWAPTPHPLVAPAGEEPYWVEVTALP
ncbi:MAG: serine/threonine protein kinase [Myxococcales bacterium]|nr:MAG: serine/threonine protein kinase [Myxococcales bacterium]